MRSAILTALLLLIVSMPVMAATGHHKARVASAFTPELAQLIVVTARQYNLDPFLVLELMRQESGFHSRVRSSKGAAGLMQFIPSTAIRFGINDPTNPQQAVAGGCRYLVFLMQRYDGQLDKVLAAYNAGENNVDKYNGVPPFRETQNYVRAIIIAYNRARNLADSVANNQGNYRHYTNSQPLTNQQIMNRLSAIDNLLSK